MYLIGLNHSIFKTHFQEKISSSKQKAEATYLMGSTVLEFSVTIPAGQYVRPANLELALAVRSETGHPKKFTWEGGYPSISFSDSTLKSFENDYTSTTFW